MDRLSIIPLDHIAPREPLHAEHIFRLRAVVDELPDDLLAFFE